MTKDEIVAAMCDATKYQGTSSMLMSQLGSSARIASLHGSEQAGLTTNNKQAARYAGPFLCESAASVSKTSDGAIPRSRSDSCGRQPVTSSQFGKDSMHEALAEFDKESLDHEQRTRLNTVRYWTDIFFGLVPEELQRLEPRAKEMDG